MKAKVIRCILTIFLIVTVRSARSYTEAETNAVVSALIECMAMAPEASDCFDGSETGMVEVAFASYDSLFDVAFADGMPGSTWTSAEKRSAFESFLKRAEDNPSSLAVAERNELYEALDFFADHGWTNALPAANALLADASSHWTNEAMHLFDRFATASDDTTRFVESVTTNVLAGNDIARNNIYASYAGKLVDAFRLGETSVATNGAAMLYRNFSDGAGGKALDVLLLALYPSYETSSNRLFVANESLDWEHVMPSVRFHFMSVTNQLMSLQQPLPSVPGLQRQNIDN